MLNQQELKTLSARFQTGGNLDQDEAEALRAGLNDQAKAAGRTLFETEDSVADVQALLAATPKPPAQPATGRPPTSGNPTNTADAALLAQYQAVQGDPVKRAEFLAENAAEIGRLLRATDREAIAADQKRNTQAGGNTPAPIHPALLEQYQSVQNDPVKRAQFLQEHADALNALPSR